MNEYHKYLEKWIKNIEEAGVDGDFFTYLDEDEINCMLSAAVCCKLSKIMDKNVCYTPYGVELAYDELKADEKQKVFNEFLSYLKSTYLNWEKEKIKLVSKTKLKKIIKYKQELAKFYEYQFTKIKLLKSGSIAETYKNDVIKCILNERMFYLHCFLSITEKSWNKIEFRYDGVYIPSIPEENETYYEFIIRTIDEINKENEFIEFVWDKDEE